MINKYKRYNENNITHSIDIGLSDTSTVTLMVGGDYLLVTDPFQLLASNLHLTINRKTLTSDIITSCEGIPSNTVIGANVKRSWYRMDRTIHWIRLMPYDDIGNDAIEDQLRIVAEKNGNDDMTGICESMVITPIIRKLYNISPLRDILKTDNLAFKYATEPSTRRIKNIQATPIGQYFLTKDPMVAMTGKPTDNAYKDLVGENPTNAAEEKPNATEDTTEPKESNKESNAEEKPNATEANTTKTAFEALTSLN